MFDITYAISPFIKKNFRDLSFIYLFYVCFRFVKMALNVLLWRLRWEWYIGASQYDADDGK